MKNKDIKEMYDTTIGQKYDNNYEFKRWFTTPRLRLDYAMTYLAITYHIKDLDFRNCLEVGPGPGTWTKVLFRENPGAQFSLVDISKEMRNQFNLEMRNQKNIQYTVSDIVTYTTSEKYDLFFSSRALEYFEDKIVLIKKIFNLMENGGVGIIITKNPLFSWYKKEGSRPQHKGKISPKELQKKLENAGFKDIKIYPVIIRFPLIDRFNLSFSEKYFHSVYKNAFNKKVSKYTESYVVIFKK